MRLERFLLGVLTLLPVLALAAPSPVADAAMRRDQQSIRELIAKKTDVNAPQPDGATALHWAAYNNDLATADVLIAASAKASAANREGVTPLLLASLNGNAAMIKKLLAAGASPSEASPSGDTALMMSARNGNRGISTIPSAQHHRACAWEHPL